MNEVAVKRREMVEIMEAYLESLIEKKPEVLPLAENCRATYNGKDTPVGSSELWRNTLVLRQRQIFLDPVSGEMVFFGVMTNEPFEMNYNFPVDVNVYSKTYVATIRIKVVNGQITEVEELADDKRLRNFYGYAKDIVLPDLEFEIPIPEEERSTREELVGLIETYWDCAAKWQPAEALHIHPDAQRFENSYQTTNHFNSFREDFKHNKGFQWNVPKATRSYPVVDPARGLVVSCCVMKAVLTLLMVPGVPISR